MRQPHRHKDQPKTGPLLTDTEIRGRAIAGRRLLGQVERLRRGYREGPNTQARCSCQPPCYTFADHWAAQDAAADILRDLYHSSGLFPPNDEAGDTP